MTGKVGRFLALLTLLMIFTGNAYVHAQGSARVNIEYIENGQFPNLEVYTSVTNAQGFPISNLTRSDFTISEDNQPIADFELLPVQNTKQSLAVVLVIDTSGSMDTSKTPTPLQQSANAAKAFVEALAGQDFVAIVSFADTPTVVQKLTDDKNLVKTKLDSLTAGGNTSLYDAIVEGVGLLKNRPERRLLILLTDGKDSSIGTFDFKTAMDEATRWTVPIYPIGFGDVDQKELEQMAILTGGLAQVKPDVTSVQASFETVLQVLREQYLIRFKSSLQADGANHNLQISTQGQSAVQTFIARPGEITITIPFQDGQVVGGNILLKPAVLAPAPVTEIEILLDGNRLQKVLSEPFQYAWDSTTVTPGLHQFTFVVNDGAGNTAQKDFRLNIQPPITVKITAPVPETELSGASKVVVDVEALAGVAKVEYFIDEVPIRTLTQAPYELNIDWNNYSKGSHLLEVKATDVNGFSDTEQVVIQAAGTKVILFLIILLVVAAAGLSIPFGRRWWRASVEPVPQVKKRFLRMIEGSDIDQTWNLDEQEISIGRKRSNVIQLKSPKASRESAIIRHENGEHVLYNLQEENPPLVNNEPVPDKRTLQTGDMIQFGEDVLRYEQHE